MREIKAIVDLTMSIREDMRLFPGMSKPYLRPLKTHGRNGSQVTRIEMGVHAGTHVDAPRHFIRSGKTIDETSLERLVGEAVIFDLKSQPPGGMITPGDLERYAMEVRRDDIVILNTGYEGYADPDQYCTLDAGAAQWLVEHKIRCLAMDMPSVDPVPGKNVRASRETHPAHQIILNAGIPIVENLVNLDSLTTQRVFFLCFPLKIWGCEAAPARAVVMEFD